MTIKIKTFSLIYILSVVINCNCISQTKKIENIEKDVVKQYSDLLKCKFKANSDSLNYYSDRFSENFKNIISNNPKSLNYNFKILIDSNYCDIITSIDSNFRIYSWDTWTGGTMHFFNEIYQYKYNDKVFIKIPKYDEGDAGSFCSKIYTVNVRNKVFYLAITNGIYSTKDVSQSVSVFTIDNRKLIDTVNLFKTKTKLLNRIDVEFDLFKLNRPERTLELITYDEKLKIIYIPVVDDKGVMTEKNILYQLKDNYFEFIGIEKGKRK